MAMHKVTSYSSSSSHVEEVVDKNKLDKLLEILVEDARNRSTAPLDEINSTLALFLDESENSSGDDVLNGRRQRGASCRNINSPVYLKMLQTLETKLYEQFDKNADKSGMNVMNLSPMRLLAEHRRKLILKSLCGFSDISGDRDKANIVVANSFNYKTCQLPALTSDKAKILNDTDWHRKQLREEKKKLKKTLGPSSKLQRKMLPDTENTTARFVPDWNNYDVMRSRWTALQAQTKKLLPDEELLLPSSSIDNDIKVKSMDTPIQGRYLDSIYFDRTVTSIQTRDETRSKLSHSRSLSAALQDGMNTISMNSNASPMSTSASISSRVVMSREVRSQTSRSRASIKSIGEV